MFLIYAASKFWKEDKRIPLLAYAAFFLMLVEAVMGKMVVDTNLKPGLITVHMIIGLIIIGLLLYLKFIVSTDKKKYNYNSLFNKLLIISVIFSLIQVAMGTQVRQFIDEQVNSLVLKTRIIA